MRTCVRARVSFQVERVVEPFAAEGTQIALDVRVTLHVPVQQPLEREALGAEAARELGRIVRIGSGDRAGCRRTRTSAAFTRLARPLVVVVVMLLLLWLLLLQLVVVERRLRIRFGSVAGGILAFAADQRVLDPVAAVDEFQRRIARQTQLHRDILNEDIMSKYDMRAAVQHVDRTASKMYGTSASVACSRRTRC